MCVWERRGNKYYTFVPAWVQNQEARQIEIHMSALLRIERCWWKWLKYVATIRFVTWMLVKQAHSLVTGGTTDFPLQQHSFYHSVYMTQLTKRICSEQWTDDPKGERGRAMRLIPLSKPTNHIIYSFSLGEEWGIEPREAWKCYSVIIIHPCRNMNSGKRRFFLQYNLSFLYSFLQFVPLSLFNLLEMSGIPLGGWRKRVF